jgi:C_GCAxxG_C_C family probable redox protein
MSQREDRASELFKQGYNCAQAVCGACCDLFGMDLPTALRFSAGYGGGIGRLRETCGAFLGATAIAGLKYGDFDPADPQGKKRVYAAVQQMAELFRQEHGTLICRELLQGQAEKGKDPAPAPRTEQYYKKRPCEEMVRSGVRVVEKVLCAE